ncbi:MAG: 23S rRNA (adenine(2503)-C(2))-methyltransferase RlmN [Pseudoflavonifractor sp.]|nr:23S rRNA (adenine(2503)-C(2))-methyltransferase RlmN [Alloprevotella sp.]MCM1117521.1 23S rRNA (adenine(2503)-C(2))-methyltransferase RlmN [Pseudoflavonifractor sp.]
MKTPLLGMYPSQLREVAAEVGLRPFAADQIARRLYKLRATSIDEMTELPKGARERLAQSYCVGRSVPKAEARSTDGTVKYLFEGVGGMDVEAVYIPDRDRATLCVSSQAGCRMGCKFCMTGRQGLHGSLSPAAILNQILSVPGSERLTNLVFMGMGEPMDNVDALLAALDALTAPWGLAMSPRRITVSTVGVNPAGLERLLRDTQVHIALSLHSPFPSQRATLMPAERAWSGPDVLRFMAGADDFSRQRRLSVEYIMWEGINSDLHAATALGRILKGLHCRVNLIRFHAIPGSDLRPCPLKAMEEFRDRLNDMGVTATIRASRGEDIMAACGMLAGNTDK